MRQALTLIELLVVVIAVAAILVTILSRALKLKAQAANRLKGC